MFDVIDQEDSDAIAADLDRAEKSKYWVYDIETYPNQFVAVFQNLGTGERWIFEISERTNDAAWLHWFLSRLKTTDAMMIGFNNNGFDWPVMDHFLRLSICETGAYPTAFQLAQKATAIIDAKRDDWSHSVPEWKQDVRQIDIFTLSHFNRLGESVSLKKLEIYMRSPTVEDLPVKPGMNVPFDMMQPMVEYCCWDVSETAKYTLEIWDKITFRQELDRTFGGRRTRQNWNDVKIGSEYLLDRLRDRGVQTHMGREPIQTRHYAGIKIADLLLPVEFDSPELREIYRFFQAAVADEDDTKGFFSGLEATLDGMTMHFGLGGLHGAKPSRTWRTDDHRVIQLRDVTSYYPRMPVSFGWYPQHLGPAFTEVYDELFWKRKEHAKGTPENALFKLALNGSFGKTSDKFSPLRDTAYMLRVTINGQLLLARLSEVLCRVPSLEMIQVNTDGVAYMCDRSDLPLVEEICQWWMDWTRLNLETEDYNVFAQRDVNSYLAIDLKGKIKEKGAYLVNRAPHQDVSALVVQKAVKDALQNGSRLDQFIWSHTDAFDFMKGFKAARNSNIMWGDQAQQKTVRYHIALYGPELSKEMPPLKGSTEIRSIGIDTGWPVQICNKAWEFDWYNLNRRWYLIEAEKLHRGLGL